LRCGTQAEALDRAGDAAAVLELAERLPGGTYFRSAKSGVALFIVVLIYLGIPTCSRGTKKPAVIKIPAGSGGPALGFGLAATLFDHEGVFLVGICAGFCWCGAACCPAGTFGSCGDLRRRAAALPFIRLRAGALADVLAEPLLDGFLLPADPLGAIFTPSKLAFPLISSGYMYVDTLRFVVGNIPRQAASCSSGDSSCCCVCHPAQAGGRGRTPGLAGRHTPA